MRRVGPRLLLGLALVLWSSPAEAKQAQKKPTLIITKLSQHAGARIGPGERFRITGVVRNRGRAGSQALVGARLRRSGKMAFALGAINLGRVRAHHSRRFTLKATGPLVPAGNSTRR